MIPTTYPLQLARLLYQKGEFRSAREAALVASTDAKVKNDYVTWLEGSRLEYQASLELNELASLKTLRSDLESFLNTAPDLSLKSRCEYLLGIWNLNTQNMAEASLLLHSALKNATSAADLETVCRCLHALAIGAFQEQNFSKTLELLSKVEVMTDELDLPEVEISAKLLLGHVYRDKHDYDKALETFWAAYEKAQSRGLHALRINVVALLTHAYFVMGRLDMVKTYGEFALRGIEQDKYPRIHAMLSQILSSAAPTTSYDLSMDEINHAIHERSKGLVDFKNQHILYELAEMFLKNPGQRFSKEDIVRHIWKQEYDPRAHDNTVYVSIKRLRMLLEPDPDSPKYILRDRKGYYLPSQTHIQMTSNEGANI